MFNFSNDEVKDYLNGEGGGGGYKKKRY